MKRAELIFSAILVPLDFLMFVLAALAAYFIRFESYYTELRPVIYEIPLAEYLGIIWLVAVVMVIVFALAGLYTIGGTKNHLQEVSKIFLACSTGIAIIIVLIFFKREFFSSRFIVLAGWIFSIFFVTLARLVVRHIQHLFFRRGVGTHRVVLVGESKISEQVMKQITDYPGTGYRIIKHFKDFSRAEAVMLADLAKQRKIDEIFQLDSNLSREKARNLKDLADEYNLTFKYSTDLFGMTTPHFEVSTIDGVPLIELKRTPLDGWGRILKRIMDMILSALGIIVLAPLMGLIALAIKLDSYGPVIYKNERVSQAGLFKTYKFRRLRLEYCTGKEYGGEKALAYEAELIQKNSQRQGPIYKILNDPRCTRVGKFIERASLDELPQLFNVFSGNMSLVGPRPHQAREVAKYAQHHKKVLSLKPGLTGLSQISGRSDLDFESEVRLDTFYVENWSLLFDLFILVKTPFAILKRHKT